MKRTLLPHQWLALLTDPVFADRVRTDTATLRTDHPLTLGALHKGWRLPTVWKALCDLLYLVPCCKIAFCAAVVFFTSRRTCFVCTASLSSSSTGILGTVCTTKIAVSPTSAGPWMAWKRAQFRVVVRRRRQNDSQISFLRSISRKQLPA